MLFSETPLKGSFLVGLDPKLDERGFFARYFCEQEFGSHGLNTTWTQINNSLSVDTGTLRGLHFQRPPHAEAKLVRCIAGAIWDVIVDVRKESKTFGEWFADKLTAENRTMMYVPEGFAHGFITLVPNSEILYLVSSAYNPEAEQTLHWNDETVGIHWPLKPEIVSDKDSRGLPLNLIQPIDLSTPE